MSGLLISIFALSIFTSTYAWSMSQSDFVSHYLNTSASAKLIQSNFEQKKAEYEKDTDLYRTTLSLNPYYKNILTTYENSTTEDKEKGLFLDTALKQTTSIGLTAALSYTQYYEDNVPTETMAITLTEPLFKNSFGQADRKLQKSSELAINSEDIKYKKKYLETCGQANMLYLDAWGKSQEHTILFEATGLADKALKTTRQNYNRRLVNQIEFESANADFLRLQDETEVAQVNKNSALISISRFWPNSKEANLENLALLFSKARPNSMTEIKILGKKFNSLDLEMNRLSSESEKLKALSEKSNAWPELNVYVSVGQDKATQPSAAPLDHSTEEWYRVGVTSEWPIFDNTPSAERRAAEAAAMSAEYRYRSALDLLPNELNALQESVNSIQNAIKRHKERLSLRQSQIKEAQRLLRIGKIEFEDYIRYRDLELREKLQGVKLELDGWSSIIKLASASGVNLYSCPID
jgi:outer membrane protein TolC